MAEIVFVDIDTQYDFMKSDGKLYVQGAEGIIPTLRRLTQFALDNSIPIIGSMDSHTEDDPEFEDFPPHCVMGTPGQNKIPETSVESMRMVPVEAAPGDVDLSPPGPVILAKPTLDLFDNTHTEAAFEATGVKRCAVYGVATDYCVSIAAKGLIERGYEILLVTDAIRSVSPEAGDKAIDELEAMGTRFVTAADLIAEFEN